MRLGLRPTVFHPFTSITDPEGSPVDSSSPIENGADENRPTTNGVHPSKSTLPKVRQLYGNADMAWERHRHRYEVNPAQVTRLEASGLTFVGKDERGERMQILELADHPFFVAVQPHPEFCSRPLNPSPPFLGFIAAACGTSVLEEQLEEQSKFFKPPHPEGVMVSEETLRVWTRERPVNSTVTTRRASPELD